MAPRWLAGLADVLAASDAPCYVVSEALANVARHAPGNRVELALDLDPDADEVRLVVADHGHVAASPQPDDGHFGLMGMRERARALGGDLDAGPTIDGWRVEVRLPLIATGPGGPGP